LVYKNSGRRFPSKTITISEKEMKDLLESVRELQIKYKDLENLIEGDPELKQLIEKKLVENNRVKTNL
jgi:signal recognition particle subunit SEC65